jgi:tRNA modification GTPase
VITDTIAAIATAPGEGGLGVIRISGPDAVASAELGFRGVDGLALSGQGERLLQFGSWVDGHGRVMDEVLCVRFRAPRSFTGEDVVEIHAHGGSFHLQRLLATILGPRVRLARPGEFSQRAFLNGKMDLTRAEAVADLINAGTDLARDAAARQLAGGLFDVVEDLRRQVMDLSAQVEAAVDFPEEEDQLLPRASLLAQVVLLRGRMGELLASARQGRMVTQGVRVVLAGAPNVGKSSLMNALLAQPRSIVDSAPGTTRDYIEERLNIQGFPVLLTDTAGMREGADAAEREGVRRSAGRVAAADVLLLVLDVGRDLDADAFGVLADFGGDLILVANKSDLDPRWDVMDLKRHVPDAQQRIVAVSSKTGQGLDQLKAKMLHVALKGRAAAMLDQVVLTQSRHEEAMRGAESCLAHVQGTLQDGSLSAEFLSGDLRGALDALGEIVGLTSRDDVIQRIFSKFCIGK